VECERGVLVFVSQLIQLRDYTSSGHGSSILNLIFYRRLVSYKFVLFDKSLVIVFGGGPSRPIKMHTNSMSHFVGENLFFLESSIWTFKYCGFLTLGTLHGAFFLEKKKQNLKKNNPKGVWGRK